MVCKMNAGASPLELGPYTLPNLFLCCYTYLLGFSVLEQPRRKLLTPFVNAEKTNIPAQYL